MAEIFIEAESFKEKGGWVIDQQSMETIHSAYLMAHGMGIPVADAKTELVIEQSGEYNIWALTRDWTAVWGVENSAGRFCVSVDGEELPELLGTNGEKWAWQLAGKTKLEKGIHTISLHDLTGFNGRCDALYVTDSDKAPQNEIEAIDTMRQTLNWKSVTDCETEYDLVIIGGGIAGICTALTASVNGVKALLINDRPVLGGCNSSEIRVCMGGAIKVEPYSSLGDVVRMIAPVMGGTWIYNPEFFEDSRKHNAFLPFKGEYRLNEAVTDVEKIGNTLTAVICTNIETGMKTRIKAKIFCDCSGDAVVARKCGAEVMYGNEARHEFGEELAPEIASNTVMGHSIRWCTEVCEADSSFPDIDWNLHFNEESYLNCTSGDWEQETGFNRNMVSEIEYIRDYGLRAIYSNWSYQKNHCENKESFSKYKLKWVSPIGGKREGYRVKGDYILTQNDLEDKTSYNDPTAGITWGIDLHFPEPVNEEQFGEAFRSFAFHKGMPKICAVPYRCLYSKDVDNLFLGGRIVSSSHVAFSAIRVMRTLGMLGEVVGLAALLCKKYDCNPREIYNSHLNELKALMEKGVFVPDAFGFSEISDIEKYHFKDIGWFHLESGERNDSKVADEDKAIDKFKKCVRKLGLIHKHKMPEKWQ